MLKKFKINLNPTECYQIVSFCSEFLKICGLFPIKVIKNEFNQYQISLSKIGLIFTASHFSVYFLNFFKLLFSIQAITITRSKATFILWMECLALAILFSSIYQVFRRHKKFVTKMERLERILNELEMDLKPALRRIKIILVISLILFVLYLIIGVCIYALNINQTVTAKATVTQVYIGAIVCYFVVVITILNMGFDACNKILMNM